MIHPNNYRNDYQTHRPYRLWLDDVRDPQVTKGFLTEWIGIIPPDPVLWAKDTEQAQYYVNMYGPPKYLYLDHDLGERETGMDFLKWLESVYPMDYPSAGYEILSANPVGAANMVAFMESWKKISLLKKQEELLEDIIRMLNW